MQKFYAYYKVPENHKKSYDSVYNLIEQRRSAFSKEYRAYKDKSGTTEGFTFNWCKYEKAILPSLTLDILKPLKHLIYYSYFDLGYGTFGSSLDSITTSNALKQIEPASAIWAMEPALLDPVIKAAGGEDKNGFFIRELARQNKDPNLLTYVRNNLSSERALKKGKTLPLFRYRELSDTNKIFSTNNLRDKYYLVDVWATWCKPCIDEFPVLKKAYELKAANLEFISISIDNDPQSALKFLNEKFSFPWFSGIAFSREEVLKALMVSGIPCTILISPEGKILGYGNELRGPNLLNTLNELVKK